MSEPQSSDPAVLDANLTALLSRAYHAVRPSEAFRVRLSAALTGALPGAPIGERHRTRTLRSVPMRRAWRVAAAVLVVGLAALLAWRARVRPADPDVGPDIVDQLARERGAVRIGSQSWRAVTDDELRRGFELEDGSIALAAPDHGTLRTWLGSVGRLNAAPASRVRIEAHPEGNPEGNIGAPSVTPGTDAGSDATPSALGVAVKLERGGLEIERYDSGRSWTIATPAAALALERGALSVACDPVAGAPHRVRVRLASGSAFVETRSGRTALDIGRAVFLDEGTLVPADAGDLGSPRGEPGTRTSAAQPTQSQGLGGGDRAGETVGIGGTGPIEVADPPQPAPASPSPRVTLRGRVRAPRGDELERGFTVTLLRKVDLPMVAEPVEYPFPGEPAGNERRDVSKPADGSADAERAESATQATEREHPTPGALAIDREFAIDGIRPGTYTVFVTAPGFAISQHPELPLVAPETTLDVELAEGCWLRGRVVAAENGRPIEGAVVLSETDIAAQLVPFDIETEEPRGPAFAISGADGTFEFRELSRGAHVVRATRTGLAAAWSPKMFLEPGPSAPEIELRLPRGGTITGYVADDEGRPWPNAVVVANWIEYGKPQTRMNFGRAIAEADGRYEITDLRAGTYIVLNPLEATRNRQAVPRVFEAHVEAGVVTRIDLPGNRRGTRMQGRLLAADGRVLAGQDLMLERIGSSPGDAPKAAPGTTTDTAGALDASAASSWQSARTHADGSYLFADIAPGTYALYVGKGLGVNFALVDEVEIPAVPLFDHDFTLAPGRIRSRVVDAASKAGLAGSCLIIEVLAPAAGGSGGKDGAAATPATLDWTFAGKLLTAADGWCDIEHLRAGTYRLTAFGPKTRYGPERVEVWLDERTPSEVEFALARGAELRLHVTSAAGSPIERARIAIRDASGRSIEFSPADVTDSAGRFDIPGINAGRWNILIEHPGYEPAALAIDLAVDEERALEIVLQPRPK